MSDAPGGSGLAGDPKFAAQEPVLAEVFRELELPPEPLVLDLGCGYGRALDLLLGAGVTPGGYEGVDLSEERLAVASARHPRAVAWRGDAAEFLESGPGRGERWDLVVAVELLMHLPPDRAERLAELVRAAGERAVTCDWDGSGKGGPPSAWAHDYERLFPGARVFPVPGGRQEARLWRRP